MCQKFGIANNLYYLCRDKLSQPMKRVTIKDIASHLCISVSTVSRALADDRNIRKETRELIFRTAKELGYQRNPLAASLRSGRTNTVGVLVNEMVSPFASQVIQGIQNIMHFNGISILICNSDNDPDQERRNIQIMENSLVDGIIVSLCHTGQNIDELKRLQGRGVPMVFFDHSPAGMTAPKVVANNYDKAFYLTDNLILSGRRHIVHIKGPEVMADLADIHNAYRDCLCKHRIPYDRDLVIEASASPDEGRRVAEHLLDSGISFDAVFACHDLIAIGVMNRLHDAGLRIPEDVAVAGFSGSQLSKLVYPPLTTVEPPLCEMGEEAARLLLEQIRHPGAESRNVTVDAKIKLRKSSHAEASAPHVEEKE